MRWFLFVGLVIFAAGWAGRMSHAQSEPEDHDAAAHAEQDGEEPHVHTDGEEHPADEHPEEHDGAEHADHAPIYDGDLDGDPEDYNQPPLKELAAARFLFALGLFVVFVFVMRKIAWQPLIAAFDIREARVKEAHAFAASARDEIKDLIRQHEERISETHDQVKEIVAAARQEAEQAKGEIVAQAQEEARELQDRSIAEIQAAREEALSQLSGTVDEYTDLATEHIIGHRGN